MPAIRQSIAEGSTIRTDGWAGYQPLSRERYTHVISREAAAVGDPMLPLAHRAAALLKRRLLGTHQGAVRPTHLDYDLDEFTFRFNRRTSRSRGKLFYRLVQQAVSSPPHPGTELRGGKNA